MTMDVTILKQGVTNSYGIALVVGTTYSVDDAFGRDLVQSGMARDTDNILGNSVQTTFSPYPIIISTDAPVNDDGRPDNTIYLQVSA